jgi:hypothetical protein
LDHGVLITEELDETGDDAALDDLFDGRVALLGQKLAELGRRVELLVGLVGENALNHGRELLLELSERGG